MNLVLIAGESLQNRTAFHQTALPCCSLEFRGAPGSHTGRAYLKPLRTRGAPKCMFTKCQTLMLALPLPLARPLQPSASGDTGGSFCGRKSRVRRTPPFLVAAPPPTPPVSFCRGRARPPEGREGAAELGQATPAQLHLLPDELPAGSPYPQQPQPVGSHSGVSVGGIPGKPPESSEHVWLWALPEPRWEPPGAIRRGRGWGWGGSWCGNVRGPPTTLPRSRERSRLHRGPLSQARSASYPRVSARILRLSGCKAPKAAGWGSVPASLPGFPCRDSFPRVCT